MYKYEMHCHTCAVSRCAKSTPEEQVDFYKKCGYTGLFITEHFFNGNCSVDRNLGWEEKVLGYTNAYKLALKRGKEIGLDVFFGIELSYGGTDFLVYGLDEEWLLAHPDCDKYSASKFCDIARSDGAFAVQAHPFREADYIEMIRLLPRKVDAVETINSGRTDFENAMADNYCKNYGLKKFAGSDNHNSGTKKTLGAVLLPKKAKDMGDILNYFKSGNYEIALLQVEDLLT